MQFLKRHRVFQTPYPRPVRGNRRHCADADATSWSNRYAKNKLLNFFASRALVQFLMICAIALALLTGAPTACAARHVVLASPGAPRDNAWQTLLVGLRIPAALSTVYVTVRDARGGPGFTRTISGAGQRTVLLPLPFVRGASLPAGRWPIDVILSTPDTPPTISRVRVRRPAATGPPPLRVLIRNSVAVPSAAAFTAFGRKRIEYMRASVTQIRNDPPLIFASCNALYVDPGLASQLSVDRAQALIGCGLKLIYVGLNPPSSPVKSLWSAAPGASDVWIAPPEFTALQQQKLVTAGIHRLVRVVIPPPDALPEIACAALPLALVLLLMVKLADLTPGRTLLTLAVLFAIGAAGAIFAMQKSISLDRRHVSWTVRHAPGAVAIRDEFNGYGSYATRRLPTLDSSAPFAPLPIVPDARDWFGLRCNVVLDASSSRAHARLARRRMQYFLMQSALERQPLPGLPIAVAGRQAWRDQLAAAGVDTATGVWIYHGHVYTSKGPHKVESLGRWARQQPKSSRLVLQAWRRMAFKAPFLYHMDRINAETPWHLSIVNFGAVAKPVAKMVLP